MSKILIGEKEFYSSPFKNEAELEKVVVENYEKIFGNDTVYFDLKKGIRHTKGDLLTIPDGYLLRLNKESTMSIIENELSIHDPVEHIGKHFLKYSSALTELSKYPVKKFLLEYLKENQSVAKKVEKLMEKTPYKNFSDLLDAVILDQVFKYIIVIDNKTDELERIVVPYEPEIIVLKKYQCDGETIYQIEASSEEDVIQVRKMSKEGHTPMRRLEEIDTLVCPAKEDGFNDVFLNENRWFAVRINPQRISKIKYLAMYESKPISAIRYIGVVKEIKPYKNSGKYEIILEGKPTKIKPIKATGDTLSLAPQSPRYTIKSLIDKATTLADIFKA